MIKKGLIASGVLVTAFVTTVGLAIAQSPTPMVSPSPTASPTTTTTVPSGAPATGYGTN